VSPVIQGMTCWRCTVGVSKKDREEYEEGRRDREKGVFDQALIDIPANHPGSEAYYKSRRGEQFDDDKDEDEDKD
jgi:hypothetical protein